MQTIASFWKDLTIAKRSLLHSPAYAAAAALSMALGVGFSTAIFSAYHAMYLKPLPVERPQELALLQSEDFEGNPVQWFSYPEYLDYRQRQEIFSGLAAYSTMTLNWGRSLAGERITCVLASSDYFPVMGLTPALGRFFTPSKLRLESGAAVAVLSYSLWQQRFEADPDVIGETLRLNDEPFTIVGVAPAGFQGVDSVASARLWIPLQLRGRISPQSGDPLGDRSFVWLTLVGRLQPAVGLQQAQSALNAFEGSLQEEDGPPRSEKRFHLLPAGTGNAKHLKEFSEFLATLSWAVAIILLIVCVNLSGLSVARSLMRRQEFALRAALGATRSRLLGTLTAEAVLVSLLGGTLAVLTAYGLLKILSALGRSEQAPLDLGPFDGPTLAFAWAACLASALAFAVAPSWRAGRMDLASAMKRAPLQDVLRRRRFQLRSLLITAQVALSLVLLIASLILVRSLRTLAGEELGFEPAKVLMASLGLGSRVDSDEKGRQIYDRALKQVGGLPGVDSVSMTSIVFGHESAVLGIRIPGYQPQSRGRMNLDYTVVGLNYFRTMEMPLLAGRSFEERDDHRSSRVAVINAAMWRRYWPETNPPLGESFSTLDHNHKLFSFEIVGVVEDSKYIGLRDDFRPLMYFSFLQVYDPQMNLLVRTSVNPSLLEPAVRRQVRSFDPDLRVLESIALADHIDGFLKPLRRQSLLLTILALLALVLATGGLYAAMAFFTSQRRFEIGVRLTLGAKPSGIIGLVLRQGLLLAFYGIGIGLAASLFLEKWLAVRLYKVTYSDPLSLGISVLLLLTAAAAASFFPARSASRLDPMKVLGDQ